MNIKERVKDKYLTWKTGKPKDLRDYELWYFNNVNLRSAYIHQLFENFKYIIKVDPDKFLNFSEPFGLIPCSEAKQYFWPQKSINNCAVWRCERVMKDSSGWWRNDIGYEDAIFVATNNEKDAVLIALKWT